MRRLIIFGVVLATAIAAFKTLFPTYEYRFRLTLTLSDGQADHTGSSVIEVRSTKQPRFGDAPPYQTSIRGEGFVVDLGQGKNVVATLMFGPTGGQDRIGRLMPRLFGVRDPSEVSEKFKYTDEKIELSEEQMPTLVSFGDPNDPSSLKIVTPSNMAATLGPEITLKTFTAQMTREPVEWRLENFLPWVGRYDNLVVAAKGMKAADEGQIGPTAVEVIFRRGR
jgi:hypothetical protein